MDVPPVDFKQVVKRIKSVIDTIQVHDSEERFCSLGVKVVFGHARFINEHMVEFDGKIIAADKWVVATGSSPVVPPIKGLAGTPYLTKKEIFYMDKLPASMIILGAGPIGIEMAQAFNRLGSKITVIDRAAQILGKEDKDMADAVMNVMAAEGVEFILQAAITQVQNLKDGRQVTIIDAGGTKQNINAETILVSMGRAPNVDGLGLDEIGIKYDRRGILVDRRLRISQKHIYAAGDVNGGFQFTHAAGYEGGIVISNAIFRLPRRVDYTWLPWVTYTDPELASIGMNETAGKNPTPEGQALG